MAVPVAMQRAVAWLRAGYPQGVPAFDYFPVLALLARHLTEEEVTDAADALAESLPLPLGADHKAAILDAIHQVSDAPPSKTDIQRVHQRLIAVGWPLDAG